MLTKTRLADVKIKSDAQERFDNIYITGLEIMRVMNITRPGLQYARTTGKLPEPISLNNGNLFLWERKEIEPYLKAWRTVLATRRGE